MLRKEYRVFNLGKMAEMLAGSEPVTSELSESRLKDHLAHSYNENQNLTSNYKSVRLT